MPYDVAGDLGDKLYPGQECNRLHMPDDWDEDEQQQIRTKLDKYGAGKAADEMFADWSCDEPIIYQVIGLIVISCGATLSPELRAKVIAACDDDEWAKEADKRREHTTNLRKDIMSYGGKPVQRRRACLSGWLKNWKEVHRDSQRPVERLHGLLCGQMPPLTWRPMLQFAHNT